MGAEMPQLLTAGASLSLVGGWGLGTVALALLVIGAAAICGVEPNDIPAAPQASPPVGNGFLAVAAAGNPATHQGDHGVLQGLAREGREPVRVVSRDDEFGEPAGHGFSRLVVVEAGVLRMPSNASTTGVCW